MPDFCAFTDFTGFIHHGRRVDEIAHRRFSFRRNGLFLGTDRLSRCMEDSQHSQTVFSVSPRSAAVPNTVKKMLALDSEWFLTRQRNDLALGFSSDWNTVHPIDPKWIKGQFAFGVSVIKHCHLAVADDHKFLFFERVKPADEHVRFD